MSLGRVETERLVLRDIELDDTDALIPVWTAMTRKATRSEPVIGVALTTVAAMDFVAAVRRDAIAIVQLCDRDPSRPVPSCPDWTAADLQQHIIDTFRGGIEGFGEETLEPLDAVKRAANLLEEAPEPARDIAHECAIHRWDASAAFGVGYLIESELSCDGIDEFFEAAWPMLLDYLKRPAGNGESLCLRQSDGPNCWLIVLAERPVIHHDDLPGDVEVKRLRVRPRALAVGTIGSPRSEWRRLGLGEDPEPEGSVPIARLLSRGIGTDCAT